MTKCGVFSCMTTAEPLMIGVQHGHTHTHTHTHTILPKYTYAHTQAHPVPAHHGNTQRKTHKRERESW